MKRTLTAVLLVGYLMLVPFCFFGGMLAAPMMEMETMHAMQPMNDCGMSLGGCAHGSDSGAMGLIAHHVDMYLSITQTPLASLAVAAVALFALFVLSLFSYRLIDGLLAQSALRSFVRIREKPHNTPHTRLLNWLSLFEASPNFA